MADESSIAVAINNLVSLRGAKDVSDSLRKLDRLKEKDAQNFRLAHGLDLKLSSKERETIYANRILLLLHANKLDQVFHLSLFLSFSFLIICYMSLVLLFESWQESVLLISVLSNFLGPRTCFCIARHVSR